MSINITCTDCVQNQAACDYHRGYQDGIDSVLDGLTAALTRLTPEGS